MVPGADTIIVLNIYQRVDLTEATVDAADISYFVATVTNGHFLTSDIRDTSLLRTDKEVEKTAVPVRMGKTVSLKCQLGLQCLMPTLGNIYVKSLKTEKRSNFFVEAKEDVGMFISPHQPTVRLDMHSRGNLPLKRLSCLSLNCSEM